MVFGKSKTKKSKVKGHKMDEDEQKWLKEVSEEYSRRTDRKFERR